MKKFVCFFVIMAQIFFFSVSAQAKYRKAPKAEDASVQSQPQEVPVAVTPSKEASVEVKANCPPKQRMRLSEQNPLRKIARGAVNTSLGWLEIPRQTIKEGKSKGEIGGAFWGPLKGFAYFIGRTAVGVYEVTTFLLPPYKTVVDPEFIFADEEDD